MKVIGLVLAVFALCALTASCAAPRSEQPAAKDVSTAQVKPKEKIVQLPKETEESLLKLVSDGKFGEAADKAKEALKTAPRSAAANYVLGKSLLSIEGAKAQDAVDALLISCRVSEWENAGYIKALADAYERNGELDSTLAAMEKAAQLAPDDVSIRSRLEELKKKKKLDEQSSTEQQSPDEPVIKRRVIIERK